MAGNGTGVPLAFVCQRSRRNQGYDRERGRRSSRAGYFYRSGHEKIVRTGRTKPAANKGRLHPRTLSTAHEYECECGYVGWSYHSGVLAYPVKGSA